ncbi:MAG: thiol peroxidase [Gammaproteobacteria bacterium]|nr:thiol peroxidase [Gammaproteobacteria bacterium]
MTTITLKNNPVHTKGSLPAVGSTAPDFSGTKTDLSQISLQDYAGKTIVLNIFPSVDTSVCALGVRHFNKMATQLKDTVVLCISADLPFAQARFCGAENLANVIPVSIFRNTDFGDKYGVTMIDGPLAGLLSRAVVVINNQNKIVYTQQVKEISSEVNYDEVLSFLKNN